VSSVAYAATIKGTDCNDWTVGIHNNEAENDRCDAEDLIGTKEDDVMHGGNGWDYFKARPGNDTVYGGLGMDQVYGSLGEDSIHLERGHDHAWGNQDDDIIDVSDGFDEVDHKEEVHGQEGYDKCKLDNDVGDTVQDCEEVTVLRDDGALVTFFPNEAASNIPSDINVKVTMPDNKTGRD
jgi:Ca2+-binding RTX toxin-like protein